MKKRFAALLVASLLLGTACDAGGATTTSAAETTLTSLSEVSTTAFPELPIEDAASKFIEGESVAVFGFSLDEITTLWGLPTDDPDAPASGGSGSFDRQETDLIAAGTARSWDGGPAWEALMFGPDDPNGQPLYFGYLPQDRTGFLGATETVTDQVAVMTNPRVDDLALDVASFFADTAGLEVVQITQRDFGGRELTFDLVGGVDKTTAGWRLFVVMEEDVDLFRVVAVERTPFCWFGIDESGTCSTG